MGPVRLLSKLKAFLLGLLALVPYALREKRKKRAIEEALRGD